MLESLLNKLTIKELGSHISNYVDLYIKPFESWRKAIDIKKNSYDFLILHIVYFTLLLLLISRDLYLAIPMCILEIIITIVPFFIFIIPCKIVSFIFKRTIPWNRLFRLFVILKLQFIPVFFIIYKFAIYSQSDDSFILVDSFIWLIWIGFIFVFPLISKIKIFEKIIWCLLNYFTLIIFFILLGTVFSEINLLGNLGEDIMLITPDKEYSNNNLKLSNSTLLINDKEYLLIGEFVKPDIVSYKRSQFMDLELSISFNTLSKNNIIKEIIKNDSIICSIDKKRISKKDSLENSFEKVNISVKYLDSLRKISIENIQKDIKLTDSISKYSKFNSNKLYFKALNNYLVDYFDSYFSQKRFEKIIKNDTKKRYFQLSNYEFASIANVNNDEYINTKTKYLELKHKNEIREKKSNFILHLLFFPLEYFIENFYY